MPNLFTQLLPLGPGASVVPQPEFMGMDWYQAYGARHEADGVEGQLVSMFRFTGNWDTWEMHPRVRGAEFLASIGVAPPPA